MRAQHGTAGSRLLAPAYRCAIHPLYLYFTSYYTHLCFAAALEGTRSLLALEVARGRVIRLPALEAVCCKRCELHTSTATQEAVHEFFAGPSLSSSFVPPARW